MNYEKRVIVHGSGDTPKEGDEVAFSYRIYRYEKSKKDYKGDLYASQLIVDISC